MKIKPILQGLATYVPTLDRYVGAGTGGTDSARYCYSVWARHLLMAEKYCLNTHPAIVAELGPGDSLGIGLTALISGSSMYYGFDVVEFATTRRNLEIFEELVTLFRKRADIPGPNEFPKVKPFLDDYSFPHRIFSEERLAKALDETRLARIRESILSPNRPDSLIEYRIPWHDPRIIDQGVVDMIYSQATLEHIDDLPNTYKAMHLWLNTTGHISHQIDFKCHHTASEWNGHWTRSDFTWKLIRGKHTYLLNREPHSTHTRLLKEQGFKIVCDHKVVSESRLKRSQLAPRFRSLTDDDLVTSGAYIQAVKCVSSP